MKLAREKKRKKGHLLHISERKTTRFDDQRGQRSLVIRSVTMIRVPATKPGSKALIACSIIFALIPTVFVALRVAARRIANRRLDAADYLIFFAWLFTVSLAIVCVLGKQALNSMTIHLYRDGFAHDWQQQKPFTVDSDGTVWRLLPCTLSKSLYNITLSVSFLQTHGQEQIHC